MNVSCWLLVVGCLLNKKRFSTITVIFSRFFVGWVERKRTLDFVKLHSIELLPVIRTLCGISETNRNY